MTNPHRLISVLALTCVAAVAASAQQKAPADQPLIDFIALGDDGRAVLDLTAKEVTLKIDGRPREITHFELVRATEAAPAPAASGARPSLTPPFATNVATESAGRDIMLIVDEESIAPLRLAKAQEAIESFAASFPASDRVMLISPRSAGPRITLSGNRSGVKEALARFSTTTAAADLEYQHCRTINTLGMLQALFAGYTGRYTPAVVFLSGGVAPPPADGGAFVKRGGRPTEGDRCPLSMEHFLDAGAAARRVHPTMYVIYAPELTSVGTPDAASAKGLEVLAGSLSAEYLRVATTGEAMARIGRDLSTYYVVGYAPQPNDRPGTPQRVELTVARDRVKVRHRAEIAAAGGAAKSTKRVNPDEMLRTAEAYRELPLRAAAFPSRTEDGKIRLVVLFEAADPSVKLKAASVGLYDAKGRLTRWSAERGDIERTPAMGGIIVPAGSYRMRVAAVDVSGRTGTVDTQVVADLVEAPPVKMSGLVLGVSDPGGQLVPRLQFAGDPGAFAYLEIYGVPKGVDVKVTQELAETEDGEALGSSEMPVTQGAAEDTRVAYSGFALEKLPPGDYALRLLVTMDGKVVGRTVRTLRKIR